MDHSDHCDREFPIPIWVCRGNGYCCHKPTIVDRVWDGIMIYALIGLAMVFAPILLALVFQSIAPFFQPMMR